MQCREVPHLEGLLGISDGREGVQWNAAYFRSQQTASLGVNLEGMKYDDWPVARLIERELSQPLLLTEYRARVARPEMVTVRWHRDAWQAAIRVPIKESSLDPTPIALHRLDGEGWKRALRSARECLDPKRGYRGRRRTKVTLRRSGQVVERQVTPHLHLGMFLAKTTIDEMRAAKRNLEALLKVALRRQPHSRTVRHRPRKPLHLPRRPQPRESYGSPARIRHVRDHASPLPAALGDDPSEQ